MDKILFFGRHVWLYLRLVGRQFVADGCHQSAAALTYVSLFAVVPMMTVTFSMFSLVPAFQEVGVEVQELIFSNFMPSAGVEVQSYLEQFSTQARKLSVAGVAILLVTAYLMLRNIERVFNRIWKTPGPRRGVSAFLLYWAMLSMGPFLLGAALLMSTYLLSVRLFTDDLAASALNMLFGYLPWLLTAVAFTLMYMVVPNCQVRFRNAVTGGLVAALAFELAKSGFGYFVANTAYSNIYGAFATLPIFLLWVYLSWMIVLGGAEFVRATENFRAESRGLLPRKVALVYVLWLFWQAQQSGREVSAEHCRRAGLAAEQWSQIRDRLLAASIISVSEAGNYLLLKSLNKLRLWDLEQLFEEDIEEFPDFPPGQKNPSAEAWWSRYTQLLAADQSQRRELFDIPVAELFASDKPN